MTRIFKFPAYNSGEKDSIRFFDESDIDRKFNVYGFFRKNETLKEQLDEYKSRRNSDFKEFLDYNPSYTLQDVKEFLEEFQEDYEFEVYNTSFYGRPRLFVNPNEEDEVTDVEGWYDAEGVQILESDGMATLYVEEWDGHNFTQINLSSDSYDVECEEITDEYEGIKERWQEIASTWEHNCTRWTDYFYDKETETTWAKNCSNWQGEDTDYNILEGSDEEYALALAIYNGGDIEDIKEVIQNKVLSDLRLKNGESLIVDNDAICLSYKGEFYHYSFDELTSKYNRGYEEFRESWNEISAPYIEIDLDLAREAIHERRIERVTSKYAEHNYAKVVELPLQKIFVDYEDSIKAGNCVEISTRVKNAIAEKEGIAGDYAYRADELLKFRDDDYSRRAILKAYNRHYATL